MLKIGTLALSSRWVLAPMAGITDLPFRMLNRAFGCEFAFAEMISARALLHTGGNTEKMLATSPGDRPLGVQLLGNDPEVLRQAVEKIAGFSFDLLDFNAACPVSKVIKKGEGASLIRKPRTLAALLKVLVRHSRTPVTLKIRAGWDEASVNAREVALLAEDAGISALFLHGRTKMQQYRGRVDYRIIGKVKSLLKIPVIASGDALSPLLIKRMFDETGCDGVTIARGALGNPWIFRETGKFLRTGNLPERPGRDEILDTMLGHLSACCDFYGEKRGTVLFRKFFGWYAKGIPDVRALRDEAFRAETKDAMQEIIEELRAP
ncbi:MAG: tRNA dihydrouridine synthase DusB [Nitrospirae bacterium]|nr:tRNA dihydrouridine synthase DusB [Nitrospirota bacterium]